MNLIMNVQDHQCYQTMFYVVMMYCKVALSKLRLFFFFI